jgi:hypothetical protein
MIIEKPIAVPQMTKEEQHRAERATSPDFKAMKEHWDSKPSFPKDFDMSQWIVD